MAVNLLNSKKALKMAMLCKDETQRAIAEKMGIDEAVLANRVKRGYYDKPGNLAAFADIMGMRMELKIECKLIDEETGNTIIVDVNREYMEEE